MAASSFNTPMKWISLFVLLAMGLGFGMMPHFIKSCRESTKFLNFANAFSGGLFLGIGLFHILPEAHESLEELTSAPLAFFLAFASYALILFVEKVAFNSHALVHGHGHGHGHGHDHHEHHEHGHDCENDKQEKLIKPKEEGIEEVKVDDNNLDLVNEHHHEQVDSLSKPKKSITAYVLLLALGFHGFFEGMALGFQSKIGGTIFLFIAIAAHKWAASLTLGIAFVKAKVEQKQLIIMVSIFAFIGPVGTLLGIILSSSANGKVEGIFLAMSVGTFIYIACTEVLVEEFEKPDYKFIKYGFFMLGGLFTAGLTMVEQLPHEGGEHEH